MSSYPIPSPSPIGEAAYPLATPTAIGNNIAMTATATATPSILYSDPSQVGMVNHGQVHDFGGLGFVFFLVLAFMFLWAGNDVS